MTTFKLTHYTLIILNIALIFSSIGCQQSGTPPIPQLLLRSSNGNPIASADVYITHRDNSVMLISAFQSSQQYVRVRFKRDNRIEYESPDHIVADKQGIIEIPKSPKAAIILVLDNSGYAILSLAPSDNRTQSELVTTKPFLSISILMPIRSATYDRSTPISFIETLPSGGPRVLGFLYGTVPPDAAGHFSVNLPEGVAILTQSVSVPISDAHYFAVKRWSSSVAIEAASFQMFIVGQGTGTLIGAIRPVPKSDGLYIVMLSHTNKGHGSATQAATHEEFATDVDGQGAFRFDHIPTGTYSLTLSKWSIENELPAVRIIVNRSIDVLKGERLLELDSRSWFLNATPYK